jgi:hypothetical protein
VRVGDASAHELRPVRRNQVIRARTKVFKLDRTNSFFIENSPSSTLMPLQKKGLNNNA